MASEQWFLTNRPRATPWGPQRNLSFTPLKGLRDIRSYQLKTPGTTVIHKNLSYNTASYHFVEVVKSASISKQRRHSARCLQLAKYGEVLNTQKWRWKWQPLNSTQSDNSQKEKFLHKYNPDFLKYGFVNGEKEADPRAQCVGCRLLPPN